MSETNLILEKKIIQEGIVQIVLNKSLLGGSEALDFQKVLNEVLASDMPSEIILDLSQVEQINSSGLGMLVAANSNIQKNKSKLTLTNLPKKVKELVRMTHLDKVLNITDSF